MNPCKPASSTVRQSRTSIPGKDTVPDGRLIICSPPHTTHGGKPGFGAADGFCAATLSINNDEPTKAPNASINWTLLILLLLFSC